MPFKQLIKNYISITGKEKYDPANKYPGPGTYDVIKSCNSNSINKNAPTIK